MGISAAKYSPTAVGAVADVVLMYEVTGRADVGRLADLILADAC